MTDDSPTTAELRAHWPASARAELPRLIELMRAGVQTPEPNTSFTRRGEHPTLFDGSYDYHSCVLAHWALLVHARTSGDAELESWLMERLDEEVLAGERALLEERTRPPFTFPYEHAWLGMLLSELERREPRRTPQLRSFRAYVERTLLDALEEREFPEMPPEEEGGERRFVGHYRSWLFAYLLTQLAGPTDPERGARLTALYEAKIAPQRERIAAHESALDYDFLHLPALLALIDRTRGGSGDSALPDSTLPYSARPLPELPESVSLRNVHIVGRHLSRVWASGLLAHQGSEEARTDLAALLDALLERGELWSDDFTVVSHWVPQYVYFALWMASGHP